MMFPSYEYVYIRGEVVRACSNVSASPSCEGCLNVHGRGEFCNMVGRNVNMKERKKDASEEACVVKEGLSTALDPWARCPPTYPDAANVRTATHDSSSTGGSSRLHFHCPRCVCDELQAQSRTRMTNAAAALHTVTFTACMVDGWVDLL